MQRMRSERGSAAVLFAVTATALIGFAAIGVDVGQLYLSRVRLHNTTDFAALAGAQHLPGDPDAARDKAYEYVARNGVDPADAQVTISADQREIAVRIEREQNLHFARVLGIPSATVGGTSRARVDGISSAHGAVPIGVPEGDFTIGELVQLKLDADDTEDGTPGNFRALALGHNGAAAYEENLANGYDGKITVGDWLDTEPGNMAGPTRRAIRERIDADPDSTWDNFARGSSRVVLVPVMGPFPNGKGQVEVKAFAVFFLEDVKQKGSSAEIWGRFIRFTWPGEMDPDVPLNGAVGVKLID